MISKKFTRHDIAVWSGNAMHLLGWVMVLGLTGTFTVTLFAHYAPARAPYLPGLALAVCELGVIHWQHFLKHNVKNIPQLIVAGLMLVLSILAIAFCTGLELTSMFILNGDIDLFLPALRTTALIGLVLITILNVLAFALISVSHPETLRRFARIAATPITMTIEEAEERSRAERSIATQQIVAEHAMADTQSIATQQIVAEPRSRAEGETSEHDIADPRDIAEPCDIALLRSIASPRSIATQQSMTIVMDGDAPSEQYQNIRSTMLRYLQEQRPLNKDAIAKDAGVASSTVRKHYKNILAELSIEQEEVG